MTQQTLIDASINLICTFIGALLGFLSALHLERSKEKKTDKTTRKILLDRLQNELIKIKQVLEVDRMNPDVLLTYEFISWKVMLSTGDLKIFSAEEYYPVMISICSSVEFLVDFERTCEENREILVDVRNNVYQQLCSEEVTKLLAITLKK